MNAFSGMKINMDNVKTFKKLPGGRYRAVVASYEDAVNPNKGTKGVKVHFALMSAVDGQDIEGIELEKIKPNDTFWLTDASMPVVAGRFLSKVLPDVKGEHDPVDLFDQCQGKEVIVNLDRVAGKKNKQGQVREYLNVIDYEPVA